MKRRSFLQSITAGVGAALLSANTMLTGEEHLEPYVNVREGYYGLGPIDDTSEIKVSMRVSQGHVSIFYPEAL